MFSNPDEFMSYSSLVESFKEIQGADIPDRDDYLDKIITEMGSSASTFLKSNLKKECYVADSLSIVGRFGLKELVPYVQKYLHIEDEDLQIIAAITLTKLQDNIGIEKLRQMYIQGIVPEHWITNEDISIDSIL